MKRFFALFLALVMCAGLCACQSGDSTSSPSADPSGSAAPSGSEDPSGSAEPSPTPEIEADLSLPLFEFASGLKNDATAMTVNGKAYPNDLFFYRLSYYCYRMAYTYYYTYGIEADFSDETLAQYVLGYAQDALTYDGAFHKLCADNNVTLTEEQEVQLQKDFDETLESSGYTKEQFLKLYGLSEESFREVFSATYLNDNLMDTLVGEPDQADLEQYVSDIGAFSCKHILVRLRDSDVKDSDGNVTQTADDYNAAQKTLAEDLLAQLQAAENVESLLDQLAEQYSEDGRTTDGHLAAPDGYTFTDEDSLTPGFREATLELPVGGLSGLVETAYGYHIILRLPVDASQYRDSWQTENMNTIVATAAQEAEVVVSDDIQKVDVADFYNRYSAWVNAFYDKLAEENAVG